MLILDYNRVLRDLNGLTHEEVLRDIGRRYAVQPTDQSVRPACANEVGMVLGGHWYRLALRPEFAAERGQSGDPVARLLHPRPETGVWNSDARASRTAARGWSCQTAKGLPNTLSADVTAIDKQLPTKHE